MAPIIAHRAALGSDEQPGSAMIKEKLRGLKHFISNRYGNVKQGLA